jgi:uncharacterized OB-fold protein
MIDFSMYDVKEPEILAVKCPSCGRLDYPAPMVCKGCGTRRDPSGIKAPDWETFPLQGSCKLLTWTKVYALPEGYEKPFLMFGIVEFENGLRAAGQLEVDQPKTGMSLQAQVEVSEDRPGHQANIFVFR